MKSSRRKEPILSKKQQDIIERVANGVWYYKRFFRISIIENKLAGKKEKRIGRRGVLK